MTKKLEWVRTLSEATGYKTVRKELTSKAGKPYTTEVVPQVELICMGAPEEVKDDKGATTGYRYTLFDQKHDRSWSVKAPQKLEVQGVKLVKLYTVRGGALSSGAGWMACDRIELSKGR